MVDFAAAVEPASGLLLVGLGVAVLFVRPLRRRAVAFALFSILWGLSIVLVNLMGIADNAQPVFYATAAVDLGTTGALIWLAFLFPRRPEAKDRPAFWTASLVAIAAGGTAFFMTLASLSELRGLEPALYSTGFVAFVLVYPVFLGSLLYAILLWTLRFLSVPISDRIQRGQYALAVAALVSWVGVLAGHGPDAKVSPRVAMQTQDPFIIVLAGAPLVVLIGAAGVWLYAHYKSPGDAVPRNMAWFVLAMPLLGLLYSYVEPWGAFALTRVLATVLLAIGILRFQMLSLEVKLRWTVSRTTLGAVFIAVFFAASEGAAAIFSEAWGTGIGITVAALLVFAIAPLQRLADRLASAAVPNPFPAADLSEDERLGFYRQIAMDVWVDGSVGRKERAILDNAARRLELADDVVMRIEREAARAR